MTCLATVLLVSLGSASAGSKDPLFPGPVRPGNLDYRTALQQGYLKVYSVSDEFNDGAYYAHSSYAIYSAHGRLFKTVENNISRSDELIPWEVALPIGAYTIVDLDLAEQETYIQHFQPNDRMASSDDS
jgi:hypothetical protein